MVSGLLGHGLYVVLAKGASVLQHHITEQSRDEGSEQSRAASGAKHSSAVLCWAMLCLSFPACTVDAVILLALTNDRMKRSHKYYSEFENNIFILYIYIFFFFRKV